MSALRILPLVLLLGCDAVAPRFVQVEAPTDTRDVIGPYHITAAIRGPTDTVQARYVVVRGDAVEGAFTLDLTRRGGTRFEGDLPGQRPGTTVQVELVARGPGGTHTWPGENPHEFSIFEASSACGVDGDCLYGEICDRVSRQCKVPPAACGSDADCPQDRVCQGGVCRFRPSACAEDADCGPGRVCEAGLCVARPECVADADCPGGRCVPPGRCVVEEPCPGGCPEGFECIDDSCVDPGACGGCAAGLRCHPELDVCLECFADGHCGPDRHCTLDPDFACAEGPRQPACVPCGPGGACGFDQLCMEDTGFLCLTACRDEGTCPAGSFCDGQVCRSDFICGGIDCRRDDECEGACLAGACTPRQACAADTDCAGGWRCAEGRCLPRGAPCFGPGDCERGQLCVGGRCQPGEPTSVCAPCRGPASCPSPALCVDTDGTGPRCVAICGRSGCPEGLECFEALPFGVCLTADATCAVDRCGRDVLEPNDTPDQAVEVPPGGTEGLLCPDDTDHLLLPALGGRGRVRFQALTGRVQVQRTFADGTLIDQRTYPPGAGFETDLADQPQRLVLATDEPFDVRYSIALFVEEPVCDDDGLEENDTRDRATILGNGADVNPVLCRGDADWFRLRMDEDEVGGLVRITTRGRLEYVLEASGMAIGGGVVEGGTVEQPVRALDDLFLVVTCPDCQGLPYNITTTFDGPFCAPDALETNNDAGAAFPVGVPSDRADLSVCVDDEDWYRFEVPGGLQVSLALDFRHAEGDVELELFDGDLERVGASTTASDREEVDVPVRRRNRTYYARVYLFPGRGDRNAYRMRLTAR